MSMDDTQLIELAGKAAGEHYSESRNPLHDDALALRLAVKLGIEVRDSYQYDRACAYLRVPGLEFWELNNSDPYAATRRAIVRAAAAIGSQQ